MIRSLTGVRHLGNDFWRRPLFCQRCENPTPWLIIAPPLGVCHLCFLTMPDHEFDWIVDEWERRGLVQRYL